MRLTYDQLNMIKEKMGVENLWSFSKVSAFDQCTWLFKLKYIDKIRVKGDNCYTWWGTVAHDLVQDWREGKIQHGDMIIKLEEKIVEYSLIEDKKLRFPNESEYQNYIANLRLYFQNVAPLPYKVINERAVLAVFQGLEKYVFQGYLDSEYVDEDGNLVILDYKTSSMSGFTGAKLIEKARQLMIYAIGVSQHGRMIDGEMRKFPIEKVKIRYDMMKYCNITFTQKNGKEKVTKAERRLWVAHMSNQLRKDLEDVSKEIEKHEKEIVKLTKKRGVKKNSPEDIEGYDVAIGEEEHAIKQLRLVNFDPIKINELIEQSINLNNLSLMPQFIQNKYKVTDCYIDVEMTTEVIETFKKHLVETLDKIVTKSAEEDKDKAFARSRIENGDSYYCVNLCDMKEHCQFYADYKAHNEMFVIKQNQPSEQDLLAMLGLV